MEPRRVPPLWLLLMASAPASWLLLFASYVLRARLALGYWPLPSRPDPYALGFHLHYVAVLWAFPLGLLLCLFACVMAEAWGKATPRAATAVRILCVLSAGMAIAIIPANPWYLVAWFLD